MTSTSTDPRGRRRALRGIGAIGAMALTALAGQTHARNEAADPALVSVWKDPDCGCCQAWISHLQSNGFQVKSTDVKDTSVVRERLRMPAKFGSCHTAQVGGYVIEGHVPAADIRRLLRTRPRDVIGLAVPGMPVGSPGMEMGTRRAAYQVLMVMSNGSSRVFQSYEAIS